MIKFGIPKQQWICLLILELLPLVTNSIGVVHELGWDIFTRILMGEKYAAYQIVFEDVYIDRGYFLKVLLFMTIISTLLAIIAWGIVCLTNRGFFRRQPRFLQLLEDVLFTALLTAAYVITCGRIIPMGWLSGLHDYRWFPFSPFMDTMSLWFVLPVTAIILIWCFSYSTFRKSQMDHSL